MNAAIDVLQASNADDGAFLRIRVPLLLGSYHFSGARQSLDIPSELANDLKMPVAAAFYGLRGWCRWERREQYRVDQVAEAWFVLFPNYFLKYNTTTVVR